MKTHIKNVVKRSGAIVPFNQERISNAIYRAAVAVGGRDKSTAQSLSEQVVELLNKQFPEGSLPHIENIQDIVEKVLIENGHAKVAKEYILYREEAAKRREAEGRYASKINENIPWQKIWRNLDWAVSHNLHTVDHLNERIANNEFPHIVHESEALYEDDVNLAASLII
ncbi:MAG: ATP cone domain-containing protein, partial [Ignavibacterium sp.]|nr:ATP cone domain-containing protein [Ignavibacterium sp.]